MRVRLEMQEVMQQQRIERTYGRRKRDMEELGKAGVDDRTASRGLENMGSTPELTQWA